eukprot:28641_1
MSLQIETINVIKEGWVKKKSRHINRWRNRWMVLTHNAIYTYTTKNEYINPTEIIPLNEIISIQTTVDNENTFIIMTNKNINFNFKVDLMIEINLWLKSINGYKNCVKMPVIVECNRDETYSSSFQINVPYYKDYDYPINRIVLDIIQHINKSHDPIQFVPQKIKSDSFI